MIKATLRSRLFLDIWVRSLLGGALVGIVVGAIAGIAIGLFNKSAQDNFGRLLVFVALVFIAGNLANYIIAILWGRKYVGEQNHDMRKYLAKCIPPCVIALLLSFTILFPLLFVGSLLASGIVTLSIKNLKEPPADQPEPMV
jgi:hypothetical protein